MAPVAVIVNFHDQGTASVAFDPPGGRSLSDDLLLFAAFTVRQCVNLGTDTEPIQGLADLLQQLPGHARLGELGLERGGLTLVPDDGRYAKKRFEAVLDGGEKNHHFTLDAKGFGIFGRGLGNCVPLSVCLLLAQLVKEREDEPGAVEKLEKIGALCGEAVLRGNPTIYDQDDVVRRILSRASRSVRQKRGAASPERTQIREALGAENGARAVKKRRGVSKAMKEGEKRVAPQEVGLALAAMGSPLDTDGTIPELLIEGLPESASVKAYEVIASLSVMAYRRVIESEELQYSPASRQAILSTFVFALANEQVKTFGGPEDIETAIYGIMRRADALAKVWNDSIGREPGPHWYVGKEGWFEICGDRSTPDPARIMLLGSLFSDATVTFMEFLRGSRHLVQDI